MSGVDGEASRLKSTRQVLWRVLWLNLLVAAAKIAYGAWSGSLGIQADGFHSLLDGSSNVVGLVGVWAASLPPDPNHAYGHRKFETFASVAIAVSLVTVAWNLAGEALARFAHPVVPELDGLAFVVLGATFAVNLVVARLERQAGERLRSEILLADAGHTLSDVWTTLVVAASVVATRAGLPVADLAAALVVSAVIVKAAWDIVRRAASTLGDETRLPAEDIRRLAEGVEGVDEAHEVRSRGTPGAVHVDLHVLVDPDMTIAEAHEVSHRVEDAIRGQFAEVVDVVVHVEPDHEGERTRDVADVPASA